MIILPMEILISWFCSNACDGNLARIVVTKPDIEEGEDDAQNHDEEEVDRIEYLGDKITQNQEGKEDGCY